MLQYQVNEMGKKVFAQSDDRIKQFCCGKVNFQESCQRPRKFKIVFPIDLFILSCLLYVCPLYLTVIFSLIFTVVFKGYFLPVETTDCPPLPTTTPPKPATMAPAPPVTSAQSWVDAPARIASKPSNTAQHNTDIELFESGKKSTPPKLIDDEKNPPNINIEIHNVFSFGMTNNSLPSLLPLKTTDTDNNISVSKHKQNESSSPIVYV